MLALLIAIILIMLLIIPPFILSGRISQEEKDAAKDESHSWVREENLEAAKLEGLRNLAEHDAPDGSPITREARKAAEELPGKAS